MSEIALLVSIFCSQIIERRMSPGRVDSGTCIPMSGMKLAWPRFSSWIRRKTNRHFTLSLFFSLRSTKYFRNILRLIFWQALPPKTKKLKKKWNILECSKKNESHKEIDLDGTVRNLEKKLNLSWICSEHTDLNDFWFVWDLETLKNQKRDLGKDFKG